MTRQIDNISPGGAPGGKLVTGSRKRCELGYTGSDIQWLGLLMRMVYVLKIIYYLHKYRGVQMICVIHDRNLKKVRLVVRECYISVL